VTLRQLGYQVAMDDFYEELTPLYHLIFPNWDESMRHQGERLAGLIKEEWPQSQQILDVSCGIGTQAIALSQQGYSVVASDLSNNAIERARKEAAARALDIAFSVCDMREARAHHGREFDVVISCDNSVAHLLTDADLLGALKEMRACLKIGGGCLITVRDYAIEERGVNLVKPFGARVENGKRYLVFQVWDFIDEHYDLSLFFIEEDPAADSAKAHVMRSRCYAIETSRLMELMQEAGFAGVRRIDGRFYQPVLLGTKDKDK
jgi:SAM-dependent methyltransferase